MNTVLSISSFSSLAIVGNRAADLLYRTHGINCALINTYVCKRVATTQDINFTYSPTPEQIDEQIYKILNDPDILINIISVGFMGFNNIATAVFNAIKKYNRNNIPVLLDFTFGNNDNQTKFLSDESVESIVQFSEYANIVKCNAFEASYLEQGVFNSKPVFISGILSSHITNKNPMYSNIFSKIKPIPNQSIGNALFTNGNLSSEYAHPLFYNNTIKGSGDMLSALFTIYYLKSGNIGYAFLEASKETYDITRKNIDNIKSDMGILCFSPNSIAY